MSTKKPKRGPVVKTDYQIETPGTILTNDTKEGAFVLFERLKKIGSRPVMFERKWRKIQ